MPALLKKTLLVAAALLLSNRAGGQGIDAILATLKTDNAWTLAQQRSICEIPAPPFKEAARARRKK